MKISDFIVVSELINKNEAERARLLCFYHHKETGESFFSMSLISDLFLKSGFSAPNKSRLKNNLIKGRTRSFLLSKEKADQLYFVPVILEQLEKEFGSKWKNAENIDSHSELLDEQKFCGKYNYLDRLIRQINHSYANNCYDAAAVLMRRLFEVLLILSYQNLGIDNEIKDSDGNYVMLERIVKDAIQNQTLKLSRIKKEFDTFRQVGNFSAHSITYTAGRKDIDDIKINFRVMLEELYNRAGII